MLIVSCGATNDGSGTDPLLLHCCRFMQLLHRGRGVDSVSGVDAVFERCCVGAVSTVAFGRSGVYVVSGVAFEGRSIYAISGVAFQWRGVDTVSRVTLGR